MSFTHDDGRVNRDGITQGSGYGDTGAKARDADAPVPGNDEDEMRAGDTSASATETPQSQANTKRNDPETPGR